MTISRRASSEDFPLGRSPNDQSLDPRSDAVVPDADASERPADANPFATRWVRPGAQPYLFLDGAGEAEVLRRLASANWWGQIVGPHGTGKSTLLRTLIPLLEHSQRRVILCELHAGQRSPKWPADAPRPWDSSTQVLVDGYEQLSRWSRWRLKARCRQAGAGLLVTTHEDVGFPLLAQTAATLPLARLIVARLLANSTLPVTDEDIQQCWDRHPGNLREMLFALYDLYESRRRPSAPRT